MGVADHCGVVLSKREGPGQTGKLGWYEFITTSHDRDNNRCNYWVLQNSSSSKQGISYLIWTGETK